MEEFLRERGVEDPAIEYIKDEKVDCKIVCCMDGELSQLAHVLKLGDRIALKRFCEKETQPAGKTSTLCSAMRTRRQSLLDRLKKDTRMANSTDDNNPTASTSQPCEQGNAKEIQGKDSSRERRRVQIGWSHNGRVVKYSRGGGSRKLDVEKSTNLEMLLQQVITLFFTDGISKKGLKLNDCKCSLRDFSNSQITGQSEMTVGDMYKQVKPSGILRFYLETTSELDVLGEVHANEEDRPAKKSKTTKHNSSNQDETNEDHEVTTVPSLTVSIVEDFDDDEYLPAIDPNAVFHVTEFNSAVTACDETCVSAIGLPSQPWSPRKSRSLAKSGTSPPPLLTATPRSPPQPGLQSPNPPPPSPNQPLHSPTLTRSTTPPPRSPTPPPRSPTPPPRSPTPPPRSPTPPPRSPTPPPRSPTPPPRSPTPPPSLPTQQGASQLITVHRCHILHELINVFMDPDILNIPLSFSFIDEVGADMSGVSREAYTAFWAEFYLTSASGETERVPAIHPEFGLEEWMAVGRILSKGYQDLRLFPTRLSPAFVTALVHGEQAVTPLMLIESYKAFVSPLDADIINKALCGEMSDNDKDDLLDILSRADCHTVPSEDNMRETLINAAHKELIQVPKYALDAMSSTSRDSLQLLLPSIQAILTLYEETKPAPRKFIRVIKATPTNSGQEQALGYLKQFIRSLDPQKLRKFIRHCTGAEMLCFDSMFVEFNAVKKGAGRCPIAHTCGPTLILPSTYTSYNEFRCELSNILDSGYLKMDIV